jgi:predicted component of type VI protein secretion system
MADPRQTVLPAAQFFNTLRVSSNQREFYFDLGQSTSEPGVAQLVGRFVTTPGHAKEIAAVLAKTLAHYEERFGNIPPAPEEESTS